MRRDNFYNLEYSDYWADIFYYTDNVLVTTLYSQLHVSLSLPDTSRSG